MKKQHKHQSLLILPLCGTIAGIYMHATYNLSFIILSIGITIILMLTLWGLFQKHHRLLLWCSAAIMFFAGAVCFHMQHYEHQLLHKLIAGKKINIVAVVHDKNDWKHEHGYGEVLRLHVCEFSPYNSLTRESVSFDVLCYHRYPTSVHVGDIVLIKDVTLKPTLPSAQHDKPTYNDYLLKENVFCSIFTTGSRPFICINRPHWSIKRWIWNVRNTTYETLKKKLSPIAGTYYGLIFLGNKQHDGIDDLKDTFNYWGLAHYLARSGLHIVLFIMIWTLILRLLPIHLTIKSCLMMLIGIIYDYLSWSSTPFVRAYYAFLLTKIGEISYHHIYYLHTLSLICLWMLLFNPMHLFFLDFQLTFALTFALVFCSDFSHERKC